jgi:hypothetical protein
MCITLFAAMFMLPTRPAQDCIEVNSQHVAMTERKGKPALGNLSNLYCRQPGKWKGRPN